MADGSSKEGTKAQRVVERLLDDLQTGNGEGFLSHLDDDAVWEVMGENFLRHDSVYEGRDAIARDFLGTVGTVYDPATLKVEVHRFIGDDSTVAAEWTVTAQTAGVRPTGTATASSSR